MNNKNLKRAIACGLTLSMLFAAPLARAYAETSTSVAAEDGYVISETLPYYNVFSGTVKMITNYVDQDGNEVEGKLFVLTENADGELVNFIVTNDTYMTTNTELSEGSGFMGIYDARRPVIMIYPPQYEAVIAAVDLPAGYSIKADMFDKDMLSFDASLKLNLSDDTEIVYHDNSAFEGDISELAGKRLAVVYSISTASIPAQTSPEKVIILQGSAADTEDTETTDTEESKTETNDDTATIHVSEMEIVVNNEIIESLAAYETGDGVVMVQLRPIAEALGYNIVWENDTKTVFLNNSISLTINKDSYNYMRMTPIELGTAPVLAEPGHTFVPLKFFSEVARVGDVRISDTQIIINSGILIIEE